MRPQFAILHKVFCSPIDTEDCVTDKSTVEQEVCRPRCLPGTALCAGPPGKPLPCSRWQARYLLANAAYWWAVLHPLQARFATESGVLDTKTMADMGMRTVHGTLALACRIANLSLARMLI